MLSVLPKGLSINPTTAAQAGGKGRHNRMSYPRYKPSTGMLLVYPPVPARVLHGSSPFIWVYMTLFAFNVYQSEIYT